MSELPSGTVTFLFTDIERSTESAATLGDERWAEALQIHRDVLRPVFDKHGGVEVKTEGDAFFIAFVHARDAVRAAVDGQRALEAFAWPGETRLRVRMGMHTGEALVRDHDYVGHAVHKAKRVSDAGHGGQIVVSQATADLVRDEVALLDLGPHRLKDLAERQQLYQIGDERFPPLRSLEAFRHNLPAQRSSFVGRERELGEINGLLGEHRLVTLTGVGGCGKTRLALQAAAEALDDFPDGVFFVDLSAVADGALVANAVVEAIGAATLAGGPSAPADVVVRHIGSKRMLLVLDNCEHVLDDCAEIVDRVLTGCPNLSILATSRESMDVVGEQSWRVPSLTLSDEDPAHSEAVSLFSARAHAADAGFELNGGNIDAVVEICRRLDGMPLAIEFAAARVTHLSPGQIAERLSDMFKLLTGGRRRVQRQQTLQAALDWSYELLTAPEQRLLRTLGVFAGGFTLDAAEGVFGDDVVQLLGSLVSKSLVSTESGTGATRYRLLETVRLYAEEKLREAGEADGARVRHRDWYYAWIAPMDTISAWLDTATLREFEREIGNLRAALSWSLAEGRLDMIGAIVSRLAAYWANGGAIDEGYEWASAVAAAPSDVAVEHLVDCHALLAYLSLIKLDGRAMEHARRAIDLAGGRTSPGLLIATIFLAFNLAIVAAVTRSEDTAAEARRWSDEGIAMSRADGGDGESWAQFYRGNVELTLGDLREAAARYELATSLGGKSKNPLWIDPRIASSHNGLISVVHHLIGNDSRALEFADRSLSVNAGDHAADLPFADAAVMYADGPPALAVAASGDHGRARAAVRRHLTLRLRDVAPLKINDALVYCGALAFIEGDAARAAVLLAAARHGGGADDFAGPAFRTPAGAAVYSHYLPLVRTTLDGDEARRLRDRGKAMSIDEAVAYALEGLGA